MKDVLPLDGLKGYTWLDRIMGYPGRDGVFAVPVPIADAGVLGTAALELSWMGYIAETTGEAPGDSYPRPTHPSVVCFAAVALCVANQQL